ncbi:hypothetical protein [Entomospira culicis]|uniref:CpXC domain-containing protein n=1 Tax=Entomospira culicis TaxID=2719989 RepID=A0A968GG62_9SPIO|nr:hypothetical protein [Entomospira culicis]NIZ18996.1 hypothetical protein [Entomospira culicis]NIZ69211.1 hypothetical protein [Entomospira culicis]WDI37797.1 hypothetical protein PVA46_03150 [Entomospira culicis]WDI39425.1 hypothetical protein PVA47_03155 [Entomospira culicis]
MREESYPTLYAKAFICPLCGVYSEQQWQILYTKNSARISLSTCQKCQATMLWHNHEIIEPPIEMTLPLHYLTPESLKPAYLQAMMALKYDVSLSYGYIQQAIYQLFCYMNGRASVMLEDVVRWQEVELGSWELWQEVRSYYIFEDKRNDSMQITLQHPPTREEVERGFRLFNRIVEECLATPRHMAYYFSREADEQSRQKRIDPDFFSRD